jgi:HEAT repeat protein
VRLVAARALASLKRSGLEDLASQLGGKFGPAWNIDRLVAANLLAHHEGDAALALLERMADDAEPAVAGQAMQRLLEIAPDRLIARAEKSLASPDSRIRRLTVEALATKPSPESIARLAPQLDDRVIEIRILVRRTILKMAADEQLRPAAVAHTSTVLGQDRWRVLEQAILILTELDQKQIGNRLLELLDHSRPEVFVTAAWGLRKLAVPELVERMIAAATKLSDQLKGDQFANDRSNELAQLIEAMGEMRHAPAEPHLRIYVPKGSYFEQVRAAAIWSLGHLLEGKPDAQLAQQLEERMNDVGSIPPETTRVRSMSAVTLGRMKSEPSLPTLRKWYAMDTHVTYFGRCCGWSIERMTGEKMPPPPVIRLTPGGWFLEPLRKEK